MTRFVHDQFAKDLLEDLLTPWGEVKPSHKIGAEVREIDVWFSPHPQLDDSIATLGLLGRFALQPASFEPFRNAAKEDEICDCLLKLLVLRGTMVRNARRDQVPLERSAFPKLWILTPTASRSLLDRFGAQREQAQGEQTQGEQTDQSPWPPGVYFFNPAFRTAIVVIHQLPQTPDTLWLRLLGRGKVQQRAIDELEALPPDSPFRANALGLLLNLHVILEARENLTRDEQEFIMRLAPLYQQRLEAATQQGMQQGVQQGERGVMENLLKVRFGAIDDRLNLVIDALLRLTPEEFTPLLLQLSQEELIERFGDQ